MKNKNPVFEELKVLRDEVKLQSHLLGMEVKEKWEVMEQDFEKFESKVSDAAQKFGELNEEFWVGHKAELDKFLAEYKRIRENFKDLR